MAQPANFELPRSLHGTSDGIGAEAYFAAMVDEDGSLSDWILLGVSHPALEAVAVEALEGTLFSPGRDRGGRKAAHIGVVFSFDGDVPRTTAVDLETLTVFHRVRRTKSNPGLFGINELDAVPQLIRDVRPQTYEGVGAVTIRYLIDQQGRVRLPMITEARDRDLGKAVLEAVSAWQFSVPLRQQQPVNAIVEQEFRFHSQ